MNSQEIDNEIIPVEIFRILRYEGKKYYVSDTNLFVYDCDALKNEKKRVLLGKYKREIKTITWQKNPVIIENSDEESDDPEEKFRIIKYTDNKKYGVSDKNSFVYDYENLQNDVKVLLGKYNSELKTITWQKNIKSDEDSDEEYVE